MYFNLHSIHCWPVCYSHYQVKMLSTWAFPISQNQFVVWTEGKIDYSIYETNNWTFWVACIAEPYQDRSANSMYTIKKRYCFMWTLYHRMRLHPIVFTYSTKCQWIQIKIENLLSFYWLSTNTKHIYTKSMVNGQRTTDNIMYEMNSAWNWKVAEWF